MSTMRQTRQKKSSSTGDDEDEDPKKDQSHDDDKDEGRKMTKESESEEEEEDEVDENEVAGEAVEVEETVVVATDQEQNVDTQLSMWSLKHFWPHLCFNNINPLVWTSMKRTMMMKTHQERRHRMIS